MTQSTHDSYATLFRTYMPDTVLALTYIILVHLFIKPMRVVSLLLFVKERPEV